MKKILTIAGFDPSNGAGITKDIEIFQSRGIHGISAPTCIVNQDPDGVSGVYPIPVEEFSEMLQVAKRMGIDAIKIGVLFNEDYVKTVASFIKSYNRQIPIVLDTVFSSKNRKELLTKKGIEALKETLLPLVTVVTPNIDEAATLTGIDIQDTGSMEGAAKAIYGLGPKSVVVKGGHIEGQPVDLLFDGKEATAYTRMRLDKEIHGTGCVFSSLLTSYLCLGYPIQEAFYGSESQLNGLLNGSYRITPTGYHYISSGILDSYDRDRWEVIQILRQAAMLIEMMNPIEFVPAVQMNMGFALENAMAIGDVAAFPGRISVHNERIYIKGEPCFGSSSHVARLILGMMRRFPFLRSCANLRFDKATIEKAKKTGMSVVFFDRKKEPEALKEIEGKSLDFLSEHALSGIDRPPDIIYDEGDMGKEPMIRLFGKTPLEVIKKMEMIRP
ncbi:MAG TPA: bifunctional hydroxymethylpyrimidine kinase/phosphomethylpyrimidine kinase [Syntrophorhabdaceae bacterium]|nr:bifunctional hydroxymethylpyrimidine kinase/phosphomethylpyrimidine kinase [Syntrophorhabdaceae bacterium]HOL05820.1 bifunctional hydroxymethylpyrimidine kinase/phosphomethylpyrimidine kinase [Syntrophorhabdaceae bacterium]HPP42052.1 bifunctional hydroxymethylpyrimidine kinase/phosphomethylpyrimidine kinase [Syntrophorhabdaceae bacterium]